jgi:hypothetical protein
VSEAPVSSADAAARIAALEASLARANAALAARDLLIATLRGQIARRRRMQFGASSEKLGREIEQLELALEERETERDTPVSEMADSGVVVRPTPVRSLPGQGKRPSTSRPRRYTISSTSRISTTRCSRALISAATPIATARRPSSADT